MGLAHHKFAFGWCRSCLGLHMFCVSGGVMLRHGITQDLRVVVVLDGGCHILPSSGSTGMLHVVMVCPAGWGYRDVPSYLREG